MIVKYIGIVHNNNRTLEQRIKEHAKDKWYIGKDWMIEYVKLATRSEAEAFESHYISKYGTDIIIKPKQIGV